MKKSRVITLLLLLVIAIGVAGYNYVMHGGGRDLSEEAPQFTVTSQAIAAEFTTNTALANTKYLEKAVAVKGIVTHKKANEVIIDDSIVCTLKNPDNGIKVNQTVTLKGRVVGFDDILQEIKLDQCFPI
ncbi:hypothetical protein [Flavobacterium sp.]|uniref:OB-fold protein n=1 Tax=Flavobacterium sp. TaxID=239 RepID=UPI002615D089|nr:hypothetical protein [Flavobacterium sp.]